MLLLYWFEWEGVSDGAGNYLVAIFFVPNLLHFFLTPIRVGDENSLIISHRPPLPLYKFLFHVSEVRFSKRIIVHIPRLKKSTKKK